MAMHDQKVMNRALGEPEDTLGESAQRRINNAAEAVTRYMLFVDEAALDGPVKGTSQFAAVFSRRGPRDPKGRSLRDFDLERRIFRHPCSFLIYSESFDALPAAMKDRIYRRLWEVLSGADTSPAFARLSSADRGAVLEILRATKPGLPDYWRSPTAP